MSQGSKTAIIAVLAALIAILAYSQVSSFLEKREAARAELAATKKTVAENTAATESLLRIEAEDVEMTFAELFDRIDERTKKIEESSVSAQASSIDQSTKSAVVDYLRSLQIILRLQNQKYRKQFAFSNSVDMLKEANAEAGSSIFNEYSYRWEIERLRKARSEAENAKQDSEAAELDFQNGLENLKKTTAKHSVQLQGFSIISSSLIDKALEKIKESTTA